MNLFSFKEWLLTSEADMSQDLLTQLGNAAYLSTKRGETTFDTMLADMAEDGGLQGDGRRFEAHGMTKCNTVECLRNLAQLLTQGPDSSRDFYTAPLDVPDEDRAGAGAGIGTAGGAATRGAFILVSDVDQPIKNGIKYVVVSEPYYENGQVDGIRVLQSLFPNVKFIKSIDAVPFFRRVVSSKGQQQQPGQQVSISDVLRQNGIQSQKDLRDPQTILIPSKNVKVRVGKNSIAIMDSNGKPIKSEFLTNPRVALQSIIQTILSL